MNIEFDKMDGRARKVYSALWKDNAFITKNADLIDKTIVKKTNKPSNNSYCFVENGSSGLPDRDITCNLLAKIFGIADRDLFKKKFDMAVSGDGNELDKITTLHSSSLCALLHFYNINNDNPLILSNLETDKKKRTVKFTDSFFEYKSPVIEKNYPSNIDVVLIGKDEETNEAIVFFLESKFTEYYMYTVKKLAGKESISNQYRDKKYFSAPLYEDGVLLTMDLKRTDDNGKNFRLLSNSSPFYIGGIKQMISHYVGLRNVLERIKSKGESPYKDELQVQESVDNKLKKGAIAILGEIVFDRYIGDLEIIRGVKCGATYSQKYKALANEIGKLTKDVDELNFEILQEELGYSLFLTNQHKIEDAVQQFYKVKE